MSPRKIASGDWSLPRSWPRGSIIDRAWRSARATKRMTALEAKLMKRVSVAMMQRHIETLIAAHVPWDTPVIRRDGIRGAQTLWREGHRELLEIVVPKVKSAWSYAVALHELGHICGRYQHSRRVMVRERWAWIWAKQNALIWTLDMEMRAGEALAWYAARQQKYDWPRRSSKL
jgi:hypothetical protein